jgi:hypothetical protein
MPLLKAVKQNLLPGALASTAIEGDALHTGGQGLLSFGRAALTNFEDDKGFEGPFSLLAKEINHAV